MLRLHLFEWLGCSFMFVNNKTTQFYRIKGGGGSPPPPPPTDIVVLAFVFGTNRIKKREKLNDVSFDVHVFFQQQQESENIQS